MSNTIDSFALSDLAKATAAALGDGWKALPQGGRLSVDIEHEDGRRLYVACLNASHPPRIRVCGCFPGHVIWWRASITVAADRGPVALAREIQRRLLPVYEPELAKAIEEAAQEKANQEAREAMATRVEALAPEGHTAKQRGGRHNELDVYFTGYGRTVTVLRGGDKLRIELSDVPAETGLRMLDLFFGNDNDGHPADITMARLLRHFDEWAERLSSDERDAIAKVRTALDRIAEEDWQAE